MIKKQSTNYSSNFAETPSTKVKLPKWLMMVRENPSTYEREVLSQDNKITSSENVARLLTPRLGRLQHEEMCVLCLDGQNHLMHLAQVARGGRNSCTISLVDIFRVAVAVNATGVILVHNHPSGDPTPSAEDRYLTNKVVQAGKTLGIYVADHVIFGGTRQYSFADHGALP